MKRTGIITLAAAVAFTAVFIASCTKEENDGAGQDGRYLYFTLSSEGVQETRSFSTVQNAQTTELSDEGTSIFITTTKSVNSDMPGVDTPMTKGQELDEHAFASGFDMSMYRDYDETLYQMGWVDESDVSDSYWSFYNANGEKVMWPEDAESGATYSFVSYFGPVGLDYSSRTMSYEGMEHNDGATDDAENLEDLLVAYTSGVQHDHEKQNLVNLNFYHPLAAVLFEVSPVVKKITISGVRKSGSFVFNEVDPADPDDFTKAFQWTVPSSSDNQTEYVQTVSVPSTEKTVTYEFFLIPHDFSKEDVKLTFDVVDKNGETHKISALAKNLGVASWDAGYRYKYTIDEGADGNVGISVDESFVDFVKTDVGVSNDMRSTAYVRMAVVANWQTAAGKVLAPFTGTIKYNVGADSNWLEGDDGYFYYKKPLVGYTKTDALVDKFEDTTESGDLNFNLSTYRLVWSIVAQGVEYDVDKKYVGEVWNDVSVGGESLISLLETD